MKKFQQRVSGFSLAEILLSLLIMSGTITTLFQGLQISHTLNRQSAFEEQAAYFAERELEMLKTDLLEQRLQPTGKESRGRFRLPAGWSTTLTWSTPDEFLVTKLACTIQHTDNRFSLESFLFLAPTKPRTGS